MIRWWLAGALMLPALAAAQDKIELNRVTRVEVKGDSVEITGSKQPNFTSFTMADPPRLVIDLSEAVFAGVPEVIVGQGQVTGVKTASYGSSSAAIARVLIGFTKDVETDIQARGNTLEVRVLQGHPQVAQLEAGEQTHAEQALKDADAAAKAAEDERKAQAEAAKRAAEEAKRVEAEEKKRQEEEASAAAKRAEEERRAQVEAAKKAEEEAKRAAAEEKKQKEEAAKEAARAAAEAKKQEEAERKRQQEEQRRAEAEAKKQAQEDERRRRAEEEEAKKRAALEAQQAKEAQKKAAEEAKRAEAEERRRQEEAAKEAARKAQEEKQRQEAEARAAEREAKKAAEAERRKMLEEEKQAAQRAAEERRKERDTSGPVSAPAHTGRHTVTFIGFRPHGGGARVFIRTEAPAQFELREDSAQQVVVVLPNTRIGAANNARFLDTSFFGTPVQRVAATESGGQVQVRIDLNQQVPYQARQDGADLVIEFQGP